MFQVVAAILKKESRFLLAKRAKHKSHAGKWEFPGGKIDLYETPEEALERELFEEFKVKTKTGELLGSIEHDYEEFRIELMAYVSSYIAGDFSLIDHEEIAWVAWDELSNFDLAEADRKLVDKIQKNI